MKKINLLSILFLGLMLTGSINAQTTKPQDKKLEIYLLMGQSNMAGRGIITSEYDTIGNGRVLMWTKDGSWKQAKHPIHYDKPSVAGVGPGLAFGIAMAKAHPKAIIGLVPCAVGGTSIEKWQLGAFDKATNTHPYDDAIARITEAMNYGVIKGIIWHQGEANSGEKNREGYLEKLASLCKDMRTLVGNPNLPIVVGQLGRFKDTYAPFNNMIVDAPKVIKNLAVATSESLVDKGDLTHFDAASATSYGNRYAALMLSLQEKTK